MELQWKLLGDSGRNLAFYRALKKVIVKGRTTVSDIGAGTGFLSFLASRLGARECHLYEYNKEIFEMSKKLAVQNNIKNCRFIAEHSGRVKNPIKTDVVICETLGNFALEENILETLRDAGRFLKPGGVMMPGGLVQYVAPVTSERVHKEIDIWDNIGYEIDFDAMQKAALNNMYVAKIKPADLLDHGRSVQVWDKIDFRKNEKSVRRGQAKWQLHKSAAVYGFAVWWEALLTPGITLSTSPFAPATHWDQIFLPLEKPLFLKKGGLLNLEILSDSRPEVGIHVAWKANGTSMDTARGTAC